MIDRLARSAQWLPIIRRSTRYEQIVRIIGIRILIHPLSEGLWQCRTHIRVKTRLSESLSKKNAPSNGKS
jgi:hypothetical protein